MKNNLIDVYLGEAIKEARILKNKTLDEVAKAINVKQRATIGNYEHGRRSMSIDTLIKICKYLEIDYKKLMDSVAEKI